VWIGWLNHESAWIFIYMEAHKSYTAICRIPHIWNLKLIFNMELYAFQICKVEKLCPVLAIFFVSFINHIQWYMWKHIISAHVFHFCRIHILRILNRLSLHKHPIMKAIVISSILGGPTQFFLALWISANHAQVFLLL